MPTYKLQKLMFHSSLDIHFKWKSTAYLMFIIQSAHSVLDLIESFPTKRNHLL